MQNKVLGIEITNPNKIIYSKPKIKKIDVINYYKDISNLILPFLDKRLLSVIRCHKGIEDTCFFKKHPTTEIEYVEVFKDNKEEYFYITTSQQLIFQIQMGTIEIHTWASQVPKINNPNLMIFDLDPDKDLPIQKLRKGVLLFKNTLDELNLISFLKTSGGKGYHIVVPFTPCKNWEIFNTFAKQVAELMEKKYPKLFTTNIRKNERGDKIFIDWLRNSKSATCVAPYSLRAREGATISFPIAWEDLNKIKPNQIKIKNYKKYLEQNPWKEFFKIKQKLN